MKQLELFDNPVTSNKSTPLDIVYWKLCIDGASRKNPGPSGIGIYLLKNNQPIIQHGYYVGSKTNNQAEYLALLVGLYYVEQHVHNEPVLIASDSQLLVRHITGQYKVKHVDLKPLYTVAKHLLKNISYDIVHVMREENTQADELANQGIDKKNLLPAPLIQWLQRYEITL